jgi:hypothetical protein
MYQFCTGKQDMVSSANYSARKCLEHQDRYNSVPLLAPVPVLSGLIFKKKTDGNSPSIPVLDQWMYAVILLGMDNGHVPV